MSIVSIGRLGDKECFVNKTVEEARKQYRILWPEYSVEDVLVLPTNTTIVLDGHFCAYDIWEADSA